MKTILLSLIAVAVVAVPVRCQQVNPDSVVAAFIEDGWGAWSPAEAFHGCPDLEPWQRRAFALLTTAQLSPRRQMELTEALASSFATCGDATLEAWWFDQVEHRMAAPGDIPYGIWTGMAKASNDRVRAKLYDWLSDRYAPSQIRYEAAGLFFEKFSEAERFTAFMYEYERGVVPAEFAGLNVSIYAHERPEEVASRLGQMVRREPGRFLNDPAFELMLVPDILRRIPMSARVEFLGIVKAATQAADVDQHRRNILEAALKRAEALPDPI